MFFKQQELEMEGSKMQVAIAEGTRLTRIRTREASFEGRVEEAKLCPVGVDGPDVVAIEADLEVGTFQGG